MSRSDETKERSVAALMKLIEGKVSFIEPKGKRAHIWLEVEKLIDGLVEELRVKELEYLAGQVQQFVNTREENGRWDEHFYGGMKDALERLDEIKGGET